MQEIWKDIEGYEGLYQVSNMGRVRNNKKLLSPYNEGKGYLKVSLFKDKKCKRYKVHRLVANAFLPKAENKPMVNHIDENKHNNVITNLEWCSNQENVAYYYKNRKMETYLRRI